MAENLIGMLNSANLPIATRSTLGAVKVGQGINVDSDGNIKLQVSNPLSIQGTSIQSLSVEKAMGSSSFLAGVVYAGDNVTISNGRLSTQSGGGTSYTAGYGLKLNSNQFFVNNAQVVCNATGTTENVRMYGWWHKTYTLESGNWVIIDTVDSLRYDDRKFSWTACFLSSTNENCIIGIQRPGDDRNIYAEFRNSLGVGNLVELSVIKWGFHTDHNSNVFRENETIEDIMHYKNLYVTDPTKKIYYIGDTLDTEGMNVYFSLSYDKYESISLSDCTVTGFDSTTAGEKEVVISYEYQPEGETDTITFTYSVFVTVQKEAESIEISKLPNQTRYFANQSLSFDGIEVKANYADGTKEIIPIDDCVITRYSQDAEWGTIIYQIKYQDVVTHFDIEIHAPEVEDIMVVPNGETSNNPLDVTVYEVLNNRAIQLVPDGYEVTEIPPNDINAHQSTRINVKYKNFEKDLLIPTNRG